MRPERRESVAAALVVAAIFLGLRLPAIDADLPAELSSHYQDVAFTIFDEGWWTASAREHALFGRAFGTGFDLVWVSPVFTAVERAAFACGGVSIATARLASVAMGMAGALLVLALDPRSRAVRAAAALVAVSFAGAQLGRLALPETTGTTLGIAGAVCLVRGGRRGAILAGLAAGLAALTKPHFLTIVPAFALAAFLLARRRSEPWARPAALVIAGAALPIALWIGWAAARPDEVRALLEFYGSDRWFARPSSLVPALLGLAKPALQVAVSGTVYRDALFAHFPFAFAIGVLTLPVILATGLRRSSAVPDSVLVMAAWALVGGAAIFALPFQPLRYWAPLVPAFTVIAAWSLVERPRAPASRWAAVFSWIAGVIVLAQVLFAALESFALAGLVARAAPARVPLLSPPELHLTPFLVDLARSRSLAPFSSLPREHAHLAASALLGALAAGAALAIGIVAARPLARGGAALVAHWPTRALVIAWLVLEAIHWTQWIPSRATTIRDMGRTLGAVLPADAVVSPAGAYSLESPLRFDSRAVLEGRMFDATGAAGATHFIALLDHPTIGVMPRGEIERRYPGSKELERFPLTGRYTYALYRAPPAIAPESALPAPESSASATASEPR
jgi:hypothetical protein